MSIAAIDTEENLLRIPPDAPESGLWKGPLPKFPKLEGEETPDATQFFADWFVNNPVLLRQATHDLLFECIVQQRPLPTDLARELPPLPPISPKQYVEMQPQDESLQQAEQEVCDALAAMSEECRRNILYAIVSFLANRKAS